MDIKTVCLGVLNNGQASGYQIQKQLKGGLYQLFFDASFGSIYPALGKLTEEGLASCREVPQQGKPDKKVYAITPAGRVAFARALGALPDEDKYRSDFLARIMFCDSLLPHELSEFLDARIDCHEQSIGNIADMLSKAKSRGEEFVLGYCQAMNKASAEFIKDNRHLVEMEAVMAHVRATK